MNKIPKKLNKTEKEFASKILKILTLNPNKALNYKQISTKLELNDRQSRNRIIKDLKLLVKENQIEEVEAGKYKALVSKNYLVGIIDMTTRKTAYFIPEDGEKDIFIPFNNLNKALDKDKVKIYVYNKRRGKRLEGEIIEILERNKTEFVGVIDIQKNFSFVTTANPKMYTDIFIPKNKLGVAVHGDVVLVGIENWPEKAESPFGSVIKVLGRPGEQDTEMHAILADYGLPSDFPDDVEAYTKDIDTTIQDNEVAQRRDMRGVLTFTIDPKDAKDFDDALSFQKLENGHYEIGIHIADVSHYVKEGTILDQEAYNRATSIYLVDRVVPMLPEILSNFACSLRPDEDKYTFSAIFEMDDVARIVNKWFGKTVIHSNQRFAYEEAQYIIETQDTEIPEEISIINSSYTVKHDIVTAILKLDELSKILRIKRMNKGAISFDKVEVKFNLDQNSEPTDVFFKVSKDANHLIEEFMLLANRSVAEFVGKQKKTFVYRIHDEPKEDKLNDLQTIISKFGYRVNLKNKNEISISLNELLKNVEGKKEQNLIDTLVIRTMNKAKYSVENIGHYGLSFEYYSHFTSPIRRYPDIIAHRLLQYYLNGGSSVDEGDYESKCRHSSGMESLATSAERDSIKYMQVKYMQNHQTKIFLGVISGVTEWGIFVEIIENKCEGMIRIRDIKDDYYTFDEKQYALVGEVTKNVLQLGDEIYVQVKNADLVKKQLDFNFIGKMK